MTIIMNRITYICIMKGFHHTIILLFILFSISATHAQVTAEIEKSSINIGEQTIITIHANSSSKNNIIFPSYDSLQSIIPGIEVLKTEDRTNVPNQISRSYIITSFDTASYEIPSFNVSVNGKTYSTNSLPLKVESVEIDTTNVEKIYDLKPALEPAFQLSEWTFPVIASILTMLISVLLIYIIIRIKDNKPIIRRFKLKPYIPPHKKAMNEIERIKDTDLWQTGDTKEYYTQLTDILRRYMQGRYGFNAMEMTTNEIVDELQKVNDENSIRELNSLFSTADMVKFAKAKPELSENDKNLINAIAYIQHTKKEEVVDNTTKEIVIEDVRSKNRKKTLYISIAVALIVLSFILFYLIQQIFILNY